MKGKITREELDKSLITDIDNINSQLENITIVMPLPSTIEENTRALQNILDKAKNKKINLTVQFLAGYYELKTCFIYDNTTIKMTANTELKNIANSFTDPETTTSKNISILFMNAKPYDTEDSKITGYDGRSNITIEGGVLDTISAILLCHGKNITIKNVIFKNCNSDHYIQIAACKNVKIQNCKFIGTTERNSSREYVEFIQIDWMTEKGQPYWSSTASIFDSTINDGIEIDSCEFVTGEDIYNFMYTCVGTHSSDSDNRNKNIIIKNCRFNGYSYRAVTINKMSNVIIDNNIFNDTKGTCAINITDSDNILLTQSNLIKGGSRAIYCANSTDIKMDGFTVDNLVSTSDFILCGESSNLSLTGIVFKNCNTDGYNVLIRNCSNVNANNCMDIDTNTAQNYFFRIYTRDGGINNKISIKNTITDKCEVSINDTQKNILCQYEETLWSGDIKDGTITLSDDISKFKNLKIYISCYGKMIKNLTFIEGTAYIKEFNLRDSTDESLRVNLNELKLSTDNSTITVVHNNQLDIFEGQVLQVETHLSIYKITGERIYY